jgi:hypothetical protein
VEQVIREGQSNRLTDLMPQLQSEIDRVEEAVRLLIVN